MFCISSDLISFPFCLYIQCSNLYCRLWCAASNRFLFATVYIVLLYARPNPSLLRIIWRQHTALSHSSNDLEPVTCAPVEVYSYCCSDKSLQRCFWFFRYAVIIVFLTSSLYIHRQTPSWKYLTRIMNAADGHDRQYCRNDRAHWAWIIDLDILPLCLIHSLFISRQTQSSNYELYNDMRSVLIVMLNAQDGDLRQQFYVLCSQIHVLHQTRFMTNSVKYACCCGCTVAL